MLCGCPGSGKTFVLASIVQAVGKSIGLGNVGVCAPTGKAAVRITENLQRYNIDIEARTIHRTLGVTRGGHDGKGWGFTYGPSKPLPVRFLFVDEWSMADTSLAANLFSACELGTHVLLVGDHHQLPPVGNGAPLRDMMHSGIPVGVLTEIKRNEGTITHACAAIREGRNPTPDRSILLPAQNWCHREAHRAGFQMAELKRMLCTLPDCFDPIWDVQVLCAVNEKSEVSRAELNKELQSILNPHGLSVGGKYRIGDKVICTTNTMLELVPIPGSRSAEPREYGDECSREKPREFVANGEIGRVIDANDKPRGFEVEIEAPRRRVVVPLTGKKSEARGDDEHAGAACDFDLAYAITVHKAQGSQAPIVVVMVDEAAKFVCSREWWLTGLSRAEKLVCTIGRLDVLRGQCKRSELAGRKTFLAERLKGALT